MHHITVGSEMVNAAKAASQLELEPTFDSLALLLGTPGANQGRTLLLCGAPRGCSSGSGGKIQHVARKHGNPGVRSLASAMAKTFCNSVA